MTNLEEAPPYALAIQMLGSLTHFSPQLLRRMAQDLGCLPVPKSEPTPHHRLQLQALISALLDQVAMDSETVDAAGDVGDA
jgi:hypothetical protein